VADNNETPIIIVKKAGHHGGHHGGAWKIAYADFVTAMMAFFMVMWLVNSAENPTRQSIASYFRRPGLFKEGSGSPLDMGSEGILMDSYAPPRPQNANELPWELRESIEQPINKSKSDAVTLQALIIKDSADKDTPKTNTSPDGITGVIKDVTYVDIRQTIRDKINNFIKLGGEILGEVEVNDTADGLIIEIKDTKKRSMFSPASARILPHAMPSFKKIVDIIVPIAKSIEVQGHTDQVPFPKESDYSNWELSLARANEARKALETSGVAEATIRSISGMAGRRLLNIKDPTSPENRRITLDIIIDAAKVPAPTQQPTAIPTIVATVTIEEQIKQERITKPIDLPDIRGKLPTITKIFPEETVVSQSDFFMIP
jgi:chemotaxis protein MotB